MNAQSGIDIDITFKINGGRGSKPKPPTPRPTTGFSTLPLIGADKVQTAGVTGKGIRIGVIDTGVDYLREPLGGCFGPQCKIAGGYDFVGDNYNGGNTPVPDNDPYASCTSHGTLVAGLIGANNNEYNATGVAPDAQQWHYRVFGCALDSTAGEDVILAAMTRARNDKMDVINLSLGKWEGRRVVGSRLMWQASRASPAHGRRAWSVLLRAG